MTEAYRYSISKEQLAEFCCRWKIREFALFGSVLRDDFAPGSDIDVLVAFDADAMWGLFEHVRMEEELAALLGREVDIVSKRAIERSSNWIRRREILNSAQLLYSAPESTHAAR